MLFLTYRMRRVALTLARISSAGRMSGKPALALLLDETRIASSWFVAEHAGNMMKRQRSDDANSGLLLLREAISGRNVEDVGRAVSDLFKCCNDGEAVSIITEALPNCRGDSGHHALLDPAPLLLSIWTLPEHAQVPSFPHAPVLAALHASGCFDRHNAEHVAAAMAVLPAGLHLDGLATLVAMLRGDKQQHQAGLAAGAAAPSSAAAASSAQAAKLTASSIVGVVGGDGAVDGAAQLANENGADVARSRHQQAAGASAYAPCNPLSVLSKQQLLLFVIGLLRRGWLKDVWRFVTTPDAAEVLPSASSIGGLCDSCWQRFHGGCTDSGTIADGVGGHTKHASYGSPSLSMLRPAASSAPEVLPRANLHNLEDMLVLPQQDLVDHVCSAGATTEACGRRCPPLLPSALLYSTFLSHHKGNLLRPIAGDDDYRRRLLIATAAGMGDHKFAARLVKEYKYDHIVDFPSVYAEAVKSHVIALLRMQCSDLLVSYYSGQGGHAEGSSTNDGAQNANETISSSSSAGAGPLADARMATTVTMVRSALHSYIDDRLADGRSTQAAVDAFWSAFSAARAHRSASSHSPAASDVAAGGEGPGLAGPRAFCPVAASTKYLLQLKALDGCIHALFRTSRGRLKVGGKWVRGGGGGGGAVPAAVVDVGQAEHATSAAESLDAAGPAPLDGASTAAFGGSAGSMADALAPRDAATTTTSLIPSSTASVVGYLRLPPSVRLVTVSTIGQLHAAVVELHVWAWREHERLIVLGLDAEWRSPLTIFDSHNQHVALLQIAHARSNTVLLVDMPALAAEAEADAVTDQGLAASMAAESSSVDGVSAPAVTSGRQRLDYVFTALLAPHKWECDMNTIGADYGVDSSNSTIANGSPEQRSPPSPEAAPSSSPSTTSAVPVPVVTVLTYGGVTDLHMVHKTCPYLTVFDPGRHRVDAYAQHHQGTKQQGSAGEGMSSNQAVDGGNDASGKPRSKRTQQRLRAAKDPAQGMTEIVAAGGDSKAGEEANAIAAVVEAVAGDAVADARPALQSVVSSHPPAPQSSQTSTPALPVAVPSASSTVPRHPHRSDLSLVPMRVIDLIHVARHRVLPPVPGVSVHANNSAASGGAAEEAAGADAVQQPADTEVRVMDAVVDDDAPPPPSGEAAGAALAGALASAAIDSSSGTPSGPKDATSGGLTLLVHRTLGRPLDKYWQMSDWMRRPLYHGQREYAAIDAWCLEGVYDVLVGTCKAR